MVTKTNVTLLVVCTAPKTCSTPKNITLVMLNEAKCRAHFWMSTNRITCVRFLIQINILNSKLCRSRSAILFRGHLIWVYTVCKDRAYPGSAGPGLNNKHPSKLNVIKLDIARKQNDLHWKPVLEKDMFICAEIENITLSEPCQDKQCPNKHSL